MSLVAAQEKLREHRDIYDDDLRERLRRYYAGNENSQYWAFDFERAWRKFQRGVDQELELAHLVSHWMDLKDKRVLVMGSYLGSEAIAYALCGATVVGIDLDTEALALSQELAQRHGVSIEVRALDGSQTGFESESFDYISCAQVLEHLPPDRQPVMLGEIWRLCRPGGLFWLDTPNQLNFKDHHDTGLPFIHWLPRQMKVPLAKWLGRAVPYKEPGFGFEQVHLHYYLGYFQLRRILSSLGRHEILSRYRGYADVDHYVAARRRQNRAGGALFSVKTALLRGALHVWDFNWFNGIRLLIRKGIESETAKAR